MGVPAAGKKHVESFRHAACSLQRSSTKGAPSRGYLGASSHPLNGFLFFIGAICRRANFPRLHWDAPKHHPAVQLALSESYFAVQILSTFC